MYSTLAKDLMVRQILLVKCNMLSSNTLVTWEKVKHNQAWTTTWTDSLRPCSEPKESTERDGHYVEHLILAWRCVILSSWFHSFEISISFDYSDKCQYIICCAGLRNEDVYFYGRYAKMKRANSCTESCWNSSVRQRRNG